MKLEVVSKSSFHFIGNVRNTAFFVGYSAPNLPFLLQINKYAI